MIRYKTVGMIFVVCAVRDPHLTILSELVRVKYLQTFEYFRVDQQVLSSQLVY